MIEAKSLEEFRKSLDVFDDDVDRIDYLREYLRTRGEIPLEQLAFIYETLGDLYSGIGEPKGSFYQKAASTWETISVLRDVEERTSKLKYGALRQAMRNYKSAYSVYKNEGQRSGQEDARVGLRQVKSELRRYGGSVRVMITGIVMGFLVLSFFLLSPPLTGYVANADTGDVSIVGFVLVILGVIGAFFVLKKWY